MTRASEAQLAMADQVVHLHPAPAPSPREKRAIVEATSRVNGRRHRAQVASQPTQFGTTRLSAPHVDKDGHTFQLHDTFGTTSTAFANSQLSAISAMASSDPDKAVEHVNSVLAMVDGIRPENEVEAALGVQIGVMHLSPAKCSHA